MKQPKTCQITPIFSTIELLSTWNDFWRSLRVIRQQLTPSSVNWEKFRGLAKQVREGKKRTKSTQTASKSTLVSKILTSQNSIKHSRRLLQSRREASTMKTRWTWKILSSQIWAWPISLALSRKKTKFRIWWCKIWSWTREICVPQKVKSSRLTTRMWATWSSSTRVATLTTSVRTPNRRGVKRVNKRRKSEEVN